MSSKKLVVSVLAGAAAIALGNILYQMYLTKKAA